MPGFAIGRPSQATENLSIGVWRVDRTKAFDWEKAVHWSWEKIEHDWLCGNRIAVSPSEAVDAFNRAEEMLGIEWMVECRRPNGTATGIAPTLEVVTMGTQLRALDGIGNADSVIQKIRNGDTSAHAELTAIHLLSLGRSDLVVELEPKLTIEGRNRKPDFRIALSGSDWTYVEVTQPQLSEDEAYARKLLAEITTTLHSIKHAIAVEVYLRRVPSDQELNELKGCLPQLCLRDKAIRHELKDLGFILLNPDQPGTVVLRQHEGEAELPRISVTHAISGPNEPHRHITVRLIYSDLRAQKFLESEAKQLPKDAPGLIMVQMARAPGGFRTWEPILRNRLQPNIHTRVGAICLFNSGFESTPEGETWVPRTNLIANSNAIHALPDWINSQLAQFESDW